MLPPTPSAVILERERLGGMRKSLRGHLAACTRASHLPGSGKGPGVLLTEARQSGCISGLLSPLGARQFLNCPATSGPNGPELMFYCRV